MVSVALRWGRFLFPVRGRGEGGRTESRSGGPKRRRRCRQLLWGLGRGFLPARLDVRLGLAEAVEARDEELADLGAAGVKGAVSARAGGGGRGEAAWDGAELSTFPDAFTLSFSSSGSTSCSAADDRACGGTPGGESIVTPPRMGGYGREGADARAGFCRRAPGVLEVGAPHTLSSFFVNSSFECSFTRYCRYDSFTCSGHDEIRPFRKGAGGAPLWEDRTESHANRRTEEGSQRLLRTSLSRMLLISFGGIVRSSTNWPK